MPENATQEHYMPHTVSMCAVLLLCTATLPMAACDRESPADTQSQRVDRLFASFTVGVQPGAGVLVIRDGRIVHQAGYGYADLERRVPIDGNTSFRLASVSKQFTAMAIMVLAEAHALRYDDEISKYLPQLAPYKGVTIRHLLTHTGGLPEYYDTIDTSGSIPENSDALRLLGQMGASVFAPGERFEYSNPGYDMLAPIVEAASGLEFADFMRQRVFVPAGMRSSLIHDHRPPDIKNRAFGYKPDGDTYKLNDFDPLNGIVGSGGMYTTLEDFFRWDQVLYGDALVSQATLTEAFTPATLNNGDALDYGFGWRIDAFKDRRRLRHGGSWVGFRTHIARYPDDHFTIVILSNRSDFQPDTYIDPVSDIYLGSDAT
jgi:CubicO group peptidase (beta-lactamase class C family)